MGHITVKADASDAAATAGRSVGVMIIICGEGKVLARAFGRARGFWLGAVDTGWLRCKTIAARGVGLCCGVLRLDFKLVCIYLYAEIVFWGKA